MHHHVGAELADKDFSHPQNTHHPQTICSAPPNLLLTSMRHHGLARIIVVSLG
jgi:hypothetical protein